MPAFESPNWAQMFVPDIALAESFLRGSAVYLALIVLFRLVLKRQGGAIGLPDVMLVVLVSECVSNALSANSNSVPNGLMAVAALLFWSYALDRLAGRWPLLHRLLEPEPIQIVKDGRPIRKNLASEGITDEELKGQLRESGVDDVAKVQSAFVESEGSVSVIKRDAPSPLSSHSEPVPEAAEPYPAADERPPDEERVIQQFLATAEKLKGVLEWHERRATDHQAAARAVRKMLQERGVRPGRKGR